MSTGEVFGLAIMVSIISGLVSAVVVSAMLIRRRERSHLRARLIDGYAAWLAARLTLSKASCSFVSASRALRAEPQESPHAMLKAQEVQRARAQFSEAVRELDLAEATIIAWSDDSRTHERLAVLDHIGSESLSGTINGNETDVDALHERVRQNDLRSVEFVLNATAGLSLGSSGLGDVLFKAGWYAAGSRRSGDGQTARGRILAQPSSEE